MRARPLPVTAPSLFYRLPVAEFIVVICSWYAVYGSLPVAGQDATYRDHQLFIEETLALY